MQCIWEGRRAKNQRSTCCDKLTVSEYEMAKMARSTIASGNDTILHIYKYFYTAGSSIRKFKSVEYAKIVNLQSISPMKIKTHNNIQYLSVVLLMNENCTSVKYNGCMVV